MKGQKKLVSEVGEQKLSLEGHIYIFVYIYIYIFYTVSHFLSAYFILKSNFIPPTSGPKGKTNCSHRFRKPGGNNNNRAASNMEGDDIKKKIK